MLASGAPPAAQDMELTRNRRVHSTNLVELSRHLPKGQPLCPNASRAKDKARSTGSFNPR